ncbi:MAG: IS1595 family transposase [Boseongicola sp.]|nr:IS1595 family transposase [Boseongicola sp.]
MTKAPGKHYREGISVFELGDMFPTEDSAREWFESVVWPKGRVCPRCGCTDTKVAAKTSGLPYYCRGCHEAFSVKICTALEKSKVPLRKWVFAIFLEMTSPKGVSSMKLHRDIKVTQKTAWFMLNRIREAWAGEAEEVFKVPVKVDETYVGGKRKNMSKAKQREQKEAGAGRGTVGKTAVPSVKYHDTNQIAAKVVQSTDAPTRQGFVEGHTAPDAKVYSDEVAAYDSMDREHEWVNHSVGEYVREMPHTNGMESFWSMLKRGFQGVYHKMSAKHLQRYVDKFAGRHNIREVGTMKQMQEVVTRMVGKRLMYRDLIADNGLSSGARS